MFPYHDPWQLFVANYRGKCFTKRIENWNLSYVMVSVKTLSYPPDYPANFSVTSGNQELTLSWDNPVDNTGLDYIEIRRYKG